MSEVGDFIKQQRERSALSLRKLAERAEISNPYLSQIERGLRKPSGEIMKAIAKALYLPAEALYERAGLIEERDLPPVEEAVHSDHRLNPNQKEALLEIYRSFISNEPQEEA